MCTCLTLRRAAPSTRLPTQLSEITSHAQHAVQGRHLSVWLTGPLQGVELKPLNLSTLDLDDLGLESSEVCHMLLSTPGSISRALKCCHKPRVGRSCTRPPHPRPHTYHSMVSNHPCRRHSRTVCCCSRAVWWRCRGVTGPWTPTCCGCCGTVWCGGRGRWGAWLLRSSWVTTRGWGRWRVRRPWALGLRAVEVAVA